MPRAAVQLGMDANPSIDIQDTFHIPPMEDRRPVPVDLVEDRKDFFIERDGARFAGTHLIIDLWGAERLDEIEHIEQTLRACVEAAGATLLHIHLHHFTPNAGVSGVAVLAESHISVHTWPEKGFAAFDIFMCGAAQPHKAIEVLKGAFRPERTDVGEYLRGRMG
jgi:S-adenosylmethionine decarboxylase